jgi:hypothetical protein
VRRTPPTSGVETPDFVVKGVCDYADADKDDSYHRYAGETSALCALCYIREFCAPVERLTAPGPARVSTSRLPVTGEHLYGREGELQRLDDAWGDPTTSVLSVVAWGGVGKSALVNRWLARLAADQYRGAERVFAWSFYSQGTADTQASADEFIDVALRWFGDPAPTPATSAWAKGE